MSGCALSEVGEAGPCAGWIVDGDHIIPKQVIKRLYAEALVRKHNRRPAPPRDALLLTTSLTALLLDQRNLWPLCREGHHARKTVGSLKLDRDWLPLEVFAFAEEFGLEAELGKLIQREKEIA